MPDTEKPKHSGSFFETVTEHFLGATRNGSETSTSGDLFSRELAARIEVKSGGNRIGIDENQLARYLERSNEEYPHCLYSLCFYRPVSRGERKRLKHLATEQEMQSFLLKSFHSLYLVDAGVLFQMCLRSQVLVKSGWKKGKKVLYLNSEFQKDLKSSCMTERLLSLVSADPEVFVRDHGHCTMVFRRMRMRFLVHFLLRRDRVPAFSSLIVNNISEGRFCLDSDFKARIRTLAW